MSLINISFKMNIKQEEDSIGQEDDITQEDAWAVIRAYFE